jgi:2',3'-cyclic-nucleotide 2'-phosphodiesterase (5'-nucleotidase family)
LIDSLRTARGEVLLLDAGDYAHPDLKHEDRENWFILRTMGEMHYDAMTLGELELYRGTGYVKSIIDSSKVPITLANVHLKGQKKPIAAPYLIHQVKGVTCGIIGLMGQDFGEGKEKFIELGYEVDDPFMTAAKLVPEVRKQADLVIVLAHLGSADAFQLPKAVPGIDVIVFGHYPGTVAPTQVEGALTVRPGQRGQYVGETKMVINPENKVVSYSGEAVALDVKVVGENDKIASELKALKLAIGDDKTQTPAGGANAKEGEGAAGTE